MIVMMCVICMLAFIPLYPFWKVWKRLKTHHPDLWAAKGPFDVLTMISGTGAIGEFLEIIALAEKDEELIKRDPYLIKWTRLSREVVRMMPRSFMGQIGCVLIFIWFAIFFSGVFMNFLRL
jgi:hypothetical protein